MFLIELLAKTQINVIHRCRMSKYSKVPPPIDVRRVGFVLFALLGERVLRIREVIWYLFIFFENLWNWSRLKVPFAEGRNGGTEDPSRRMDVDVLRQVPLYFACVFL